MKSFVAYPLDFEKILFPEVSESTYSGKLIAHYELYRKVSHLEGSVVKCGIAAKEGLTRLALFRNLIETPLHKKVVAFERIPRSLYVETHSKPNARLRYKTSHSTSDLANIQETLRQKGISEKIDFIPGSVGDAIPDFLMENPDFKICYLNIDFDDYESSLTTLQFFYPRLVHGGILILDNFYKKEEDYRAANDYFRYKSVSINNFSVNKGPHYIVHS